jgi:MATE family multidrug resistance protein
MGAPPVDLRPSRGLLDEARQLARLGVPIALTQFGMTAMGFVDVAFLGHYDPSALSAMSLGHTMVWATLVFCLGVLTAVDPLLAQAVGAHDSGAVTRALLRGGVLAAALTVPATGVLWPAALWLDLLGQEPELVPHAAMYAQISTLGLLPLLWFDLLRSLLSARSRPAPQVWAILIGNALNALLDWLLITGRLGFPELGVAGAAWATVICRWLMLAALVVMGWRELWPHLRALGDPVMRRAATAVRPLLRLLRLGTPIGGQFAMEMGVFAATTLLIGCLDAASRDVGGLRLCGHQVAVQLAALSFMLPLGLGMAASMRVGWAVGAGDSAAAQRTAVVALGCGAAVMTVFMLLFLGAPAQLASILTDDPGVIAWAVLLIPIAGVFQIGDGLQVTAIGCLRGAGDVQSPFWINLVGFWCLGLPLGCWLAFPWGMGLGPTGLWWGLVAGLSAVALGLLVAVMLRFRQAAPRLRVD